ncbi:MAG: hypothetical protein ABSE97_05015 [Verrucomicrobiota bacterium]|jgi:hypothetical protein
MTEAEAIKTLQNFLQIADVLEEDIQLARTQCRQAPSEYSKRVLIKTIFTFFEGHLYAFKQVVLAFEYILHPLKNLVPGAKESRMVLFTKEERAMLKGFTGKEYKHHLKFKDDIKSAVQIFYRAIQQQNEVDFNSTGWTQLMDAQKIRDRITHPKTAEALKISDEEMEIMIAGHDWYRETNSRMLKSLRESPLGSRLCQIAEQKKI